MKRNPPVKKRKKENRQTHITDARGRKVTQIDPVEVRLLRRRHVIEPDALKAIAEEIGSGLDPKLRRLVMVFGISIALVAIVFVIHTIDMCVHGQWSQIFDFSRVALFNLWFWPLVVWVHARQARFKKTMKIMLKHRHCPHCGYDLTGLPVDESDHATVCPECGCAWLLDKEGEVEGVSDD